MIRYVLPKGTQVTITQQVELTGHITTLENPINAVIVKSKVQESHMDAYNGYWPEAIKYTGKTEIGQVIVFFDSMSHRRGYVVPSTLK